MDLVVAVDLNTQPAQVVDAAVAWAERLDARVHLRTVSAARWDAGTLLDAQEARASGWGEVRRAEAAMIRALIERRVPEGRRGTAEVVSGPIDEAMAAAGIDRELVVCATHGRRGLPRLLFGSTSDSIVRASIRPILVLRLDEDSCTPLAPDPAPPRRVLVPIDASAPSLDAITTVAAWFPDATITVATVLVHHDLFTGQDLLIPQPQTGTAHPHQKWALGVLEPLLAEHGLTGPPEVIVARKNEGTAERISEAAADYDLVALTTHSRRGVARLWWGSVAEQLVRFAPVPVLVVPMGSGSDAMHGTESP